VAITLLYLFATFAAFKVDSRAVASKLSGTSIRVGLSQGLRYIRQNDLLPGLIFFSFLIEFSAFPIVNGLMTVIGDELYGLGGTGIGLLAAAASVGTLAGALTISARRDIMIPGRTMVIGAVFWHVLMLVLALPLGLLLGGWIAEVAGTQAMIGVLGALGLLLLWVRRSSGLPC
jgi:hypothetical protein